MMTASAARQTGAGRRVVPALACLFLFFSGRTVAADPMDSEPSDRSILLLVSVNADADSAAREQRFRRELELSLDGFEIEVLEAEEDFAGSGLPKQIELIREHAERVGAELAIWMADSSVDTVTLHLVAVGQGRATVRTVEAERGPDTAAELALAARELVEQVYPESRPPETAAEEEAEADHAASWAVLSLFRFNHGMSGQVGPSARFGGEMAAEWWPSEGLFLRASLAALAGPRRYSDSIDIFGWGLGPGFGLGYGWRHRKLFIGPFLEARVPWCTVDVTPETGEPHSSSWWNLRGSLGLDARLALTRGLAIALDLDAGILARQTVFERLSDGESALSTAILDFSASAGLVFGVN